MNRTTETVETEIDLLELLSVLMKKWWVLLIAMIIGGMGAFGYTKLFVTPLYKSSALMYVNNSSISVGGHSVSISSGEISAAKTLVETYCVILNSRLTLETVIEEANLDYTYEELVEMISAKAVNNTEIFEIVVTSADPEEACRIANTITQILPDKISAIVDGSSVRTVDTAVVAAHRASPSYSKNTVIGMLLGFVLSAGVILLTYFFDDKLLSDEWLLKTYKNEFPLLAVIPDSTRSKKGHLYYYNE